MASDVSRDRDMVKKGPKKEGQGESKGWCSDDKRKALPTKKKEPSSSADKEDDEEGDGGGKKVKVKKVKAKQSASMPKNQRTRRAATWTT